MARRNIEGIPVIKQAKREADMESAKPNQ